MGSEHLVVGAVAGEVEKPAGGRGPGWAAAGGPACFGKGSAPPGLPLRRGILQGGGRTHGHQERSQRPAGDGEMQGWGAESGPGSS